MGKSLAIIMLDGKLTFTEMKLPRTPVCTYNSTISFSLTALNEASVNRTGFQSLLYTRHFLTSALWNIRAVHDDAAQVARSTTWIIKLAYKFLVNPGSVEWIRWTKFRDLLWNLYTL